MKKKFIITKTTIKRQDAIKATEGEKIENKIERLKNNQEGMSEGVDAIYSERKEGVIAETDVRTDRWNMAIEARDQQTKQYRAKREDSIDQNLPIPEQPGKGGKNPSPEASQ